MLFNSLPFLFGFLPLTYVVFWRLKTKNARFIWLTVTGYIFYSFWDWRFTSIMALSTAVSYLAGRGFLHWDDDPKMRRLCLVAPIVADLALLAFFKYANFATSTATGIAAMLGISLDAPVLNIVLPIGISFYTFHTITYIVDSYRRVITPTRNLWEFSCYVSLFSQLVAGPIVRFRQIEQDLENINKVERSRSLDVAWSFFAIGMIEKVLIADTIAAVIDPALKDHENLSTTGAWLSMIGYSYQLYFDFAGYSNMAVGLGLMFGIHIPQNFNSPYKALDVSDFWRRWHISLSSILRDYLYIPLGGNRGRDLFVYRNLMITMLLGGLWHGASWTFVVWGAYHGLLLVAYRFAGGYWDRLPPVIRRTGTFVLVLVGWVFFRAESFEMALSVLGSMFSWQAGALMPGALGLVAILGVAAVLAHWAPNTFEISHQWRRTGVTALTALFALCLLSMYAGRPSPFLYFQF